MFVVYFEEDLDFDEIYEVYELIMNMLVIGVLFFEIEVLRKYMF